MTPERKGINSSILVHPSDLSETISPSTPKRCPEIQALLKSSSQINNTKLGDPVIVPRDDSYSKNVVNSRSEFTTRENTAPLKPTHVRRESNGEYETAKLSVTNESGHFSSKIGVPQLSPDRDSHSIFPSKVESIKTVRNPTYLRKESNEKRETEKPSVSNIPGQYNNRVGGSNISPNGDIHSILRSKVDPAITMKDDSHRDIKNVAERFERVLSSDDLLSSRRDSGILRIHCTNVFITTPHFSNVYPFSLFRCRIKQFQQGN